MDVFFAPSPVSCSRLGLVVGKLGHDIVERNRVKRRLREIGRTRVLPALEGRGIHGDVLIRARRPAYDVGFAELARDVVECVEGLWSHGS